VPSARTADDAGVSLAIHLLGAPSVEAGGVSQPAPRGKKAWALLAYLLLTGRPVPREQLAQLLFGEADDPLGALRWNLAELRKVLGLPVSLQGSAPALDLPPDAFVDVRMLAIGTWVEAVELPGLGRELLEGVNVTASPAFEAWLLAERRHLQQQTESVLHEAALARLAAGQGDAAIDLAARLVAMNPFEEIFQETLIRSHAATGDREGAARQLAACVELFRRELGVEPGPAVYAAAEATGISATVTAVTGRAAAQAQLDAGEAAIGAGALDAGLECLRRAAAEAHACGDLELKARALLALGNALAHAARGRDEEAAAALHETIAIAERLDREDLIAKAHQELAYIDILRARFARALARLDAAETLDGHDRWFVHVGRGASAYQMGRYGEALGYLREALELVENDPRGRGTVLGEIGAVHVIRQEADDAVRVFSEALELARGTSWNVFVPYPEAMLALVELGRGDVETARERLEHAFALGCQIRDCCWEGISAAGLALVEEAKGNVPGAFDRFEDATRRSVREPDAWLWGHAFALDLKCAFGIRNGLEQSRAWVADLEALASRAMMREFLARAYRYRFDLGEPDALAAAEMVAADVDNAALAALLTALREDGASGRTGGSVFGRGARGVTTDLPTGRS
jgi:DNA-binding SARP family transcriptional activator